MTILRHRRKHFRSTSHWSANGATLDALDDYLVAALNMNGENDGTTFTDSTGRHTFTASGDAKTKTAQKIEGTASMYTPGDSSDDGIYVANHADFRFGTGDFFISFWMRLNASLHEYQNPVALNTYSTGFLYQYRATDAQRHQFYINGNTAFSNNSTALATETWSHIAITRTSGTVKIYAGAVEKSSAAGSGDIATTSGNFILGFDPSLTSSMFQGNLDAVYIGKGKGLTSDEVTALYNGGAAAVWEP